MFWALFPWQPAHGEHARHAGLKLCLQAHVYVTFAPNGRVEGTRSDVQVCHQRLSSAFDLLLIVLCSLILTRSAFDLLLIVLCSLILTLTPLPNHALLANMDM